MQRPSCIQRSELPEQEIRIVDNLRDLLALDGYELSLEDAIRVHQRLRGPNPDRANTKR